MLATDPPRPDSAVTDRTLSAKLRHTHSLAYLLVGKVESLHAKKIQKMWEPRSLFWGKDISWRIGNAGKLDAISSGPIGSKYQSALLRLGQVNSAIRKFWGFEIGAPAPGLRFSPAWGKMEFESAFEILTEERMCSVGSLSPIVTASFHLQYSCFELFPYTKVARSAPLESGVRTVRASKGGRGANRGEDVLHDMVLKKLQSLTRDSEVRSLDALFDQHYLDWSAVLSSYKLKLSGDGADKLTYGVTLTDYGLVKNIKRWVKVSPNFRNAVLHVAPNCRLPILSEDEGFFEDRN